MDEREMDIELERVVNAPRNTENETSEERAQNFHTEQYNNRRTQIAARGIYSFLGAAACLGLYFSNLLIGWVSIPAFVVFACITASSIGRLSEMSKR